MPSTQPEQFATKAQIKRLRALLRERRARNDEGVFVCEGPRVIAAALDHGVRRTPVAAGDGELLDELLTARRKFA